MILVDEDHVTVALFRLPIGLVDHHFCLACALVTYYQIYHNDTLFLSVNNALRLGSIIQQTVYPFNKILQLHKDHRMYENHLHSLL